MQQTVQAKDLPEAILNSQRMETQYVDVGYDLLLPFRAAPQAGSSSLVVIFNGAVNRAEREYPSFGPYVRGLGQHAHQVAFADPTLALSDTISIAWFAGSHKLPLQDAIVSLIENLKEKLGISRLIFVGGSGGGFASLYYSWHFPGSLSVAFSPQTIIANYGKERLARYSEVAWPEGLRSVSNPPVLDLRSLYGTSVPNQIVYLQSHGDHRHLFEHMIPFMDAVLPENRERVIAKLSYWGKPGHSGSVPLTEVDAWVQAALSAEVFNAETIREEFHESLPQSDDLRRELPLERPSNNRPMRSDNSGRTDQYRLANRLARETLQLKEIGYDR